MRLALLPVGYADGLNRKLSSTNSSPGGHVLIHGMPAAIVGRVSMDLTVVDITHIPNAATGDEVVILGEQTATASPPTIMPAGPEPFPTKFSAPSPPACPASPQNNPHTASIRAAC